MKNGLEKHLHSGFLAPAAFNPSGWGFIGER